VFGFLLVLLVLLLGVAFLGAVVAGLLWLTLVAMPLLLIPGALAEALGARRHGEPSPVSSGRRATPERTY